MSATTINAVLDKADEIEAKVKEFFDKINDILSWVPGPLERLIQPILDGMERIRERMEAFWAKVKDFITDNVGDPEKLKQYGETWRDVVGNPVGYVAGDVKLENLVTNIEWEGRGARAYKAIVPPQGEGLNSIKSLAIQLNQSLTNLANAIDSFWTQVLLGFAAFVVGAASAIVAAAGVVTAPAGIGALLAAIAACLGLITMAITQVNSAMNAIKAEQESIAQGTHDLGQQWSASKTGMADPADWQPAD